MAKTTHAETAGKLHNAGKPHGKKLPKDNVWLKAYREFYGSKTQGLDTRSRAEMLANGAKREEKKNPALASELHEQAGDLFGRSTREEFFGEIAPVGAVMSQGFHGSLPMAVETPEPGLMHEEAIGQYEQAARLVRKTDPERAGMLNGKAARERHAMVFGEEPVAED